MYSDLTVLLMIKHLHALGLYSKKDRQPMYIMMLINENTTLTNPIELMRLTTKEHVLE